MNVMALVQWPVFDECSLEVEGEVHSVRTTVKWFLVCKTNQYSYFYRYGDVISVNLAGNLVVVLHGLATTKEAFNQQQLTARPRFYVSETLRPGQGELFE